MSDKMSKEDMIKEAVEEAKTKAAEAARDGVQAEEAPENGADEAEAADSESSENSADTGSSEESADDAETDGTEGDGDSSGETAKTEKKKLFGKKNKKDEKIDELTDRLTRQMAEFDNFRKRTEKEKAQMYEIGVKDIIEKILPVVDNFERGLTSVPEEEKSTPFAEGMEKIYKQLMTTLEGIGVKPIEAVGQEFNPDFHNAVMHVEDDELGDNIIAEEFQKGYMYRDSVVRHSMVKVAN